MYSYTEKDCQHTIKPGLGTCGTMKYTEEMQLVSC